MEASIQQIARLTGLTSRALRHYDTLGLAPPSRIGDNGYRWYDEAALARLQRVLLLRELGLPLAQIGQVLDRQADETAALRAHLDWLRVEQSRLHRLAASVQRTLTAREEGATMTAHDMFDGFDHTQYRQEVQQRWGEAAYASSDAWWRGMSDEQRAGWKADLAALQADWAAAAAEGVDPSSARAQALAARHVAWLGSVPGTPGAGGPPDEGYVLGLAQMYVADERFTAQYGGPAGAAFVRDTLHAWAAARG